MKKISIMGLALMLMLIMTTTAMASDYQYEGANPGSFGTATSIDPVTVVGAAPTLRDNVDRSKDAAILPPAFGAQYLPATAGGVMTPLTGTGADVSVIYPSVDQAYANPPFSTKFTLPDDLYYTDDSIGKLSIPALDLSVKVFENESLENLKKGVGHFKTTSCWDGNVGFAGHNRGVANHFGNIHTLSIGDTISYATKLGTRTYAVCFVGKISESDYSYLQRSNTNMVTLITCVRDVPDQRWCVQARETSL